MAKTDTYYKILNKYGLPKNATYEEIRTARRKALSENHPDRVGAEATQTAQDINNDFSTVLLMYQVDEFEQLIDAHERGTTDKEILKICSTYKGYLRRIRFTTELSQYKLRFENEINQLYDSKKIRSTVSRTTDSSLEKEKIKFRNYLEELKRKYYFNSGILRFIEETFYEVYKFGNIDALNEARKQFERVFLFHLKEMYIYNIHKVVNPYNSQDMLNFGDEFIRKIKSSGSKEDVVNLYDEFNRQFNIQVTSLKNKFKKQKASFVEELEKAKENYSSSLLKSIIIRYLDLSVHITDMNNLVRFRKAYYDEINRVEERIRNSEFENMRRNFILRLQKDSRTYQRFNEVVLKISEYINKAKMNGNIEILKNLISGYDTEIVLVIKKSLNNVINEYSTLMNEEINKASTPEQLASIQRRIEFHISDVKDPLERAKEDAKKEIEQVVNKNNRKHDLGETFAVIDSKETVEEVLKFKSSILNIFVSPKKAGVKRSFTSVEESTVKGKR